MNYKATFVQRCGACGADHGKEVSHFEADTDELAYSHVQKFIRDHDAANAHGICFHLADFVEIKQEEKTRKISISPLVAIQNGAKPSPTCEGCGTALVQRDGGDDHDLYCPDCLH